MGLLRGLPKCNFRGEERYGAQVDMCHFGLVGSGNPNSSNFRATHMAAATLRSSLSPLVVDLNEYCTCNAPPWFTSCSIQVVRPQGTDTMDLHAHSRDGAPMALIVGVGSFTGGEFWVESGGLLNPSLRKKSGTPVCARVGRWRVGHARPPPKRRFCSTPGHHTLHCHGRASDGASFFVVQGGCCTACLCVARSWWPWALGCPMHACSNPCS